MTILKVLYERETQSGEKQYNIGHKCWNQKFLALLLTSYRIVGYY